MARRSIRRRFLVGSIASSLLALVLFAAGSFVIVWFDDADADIADGDSFKSEAVELILGAMAIAAPLALVAAAVTAVVLSRRGARPLEDAIRAARETTAHDLRRSLPVPERDDELRDLVIALNELFVRLDDGFGALARFAADASHELRTPVSVMATEIEVALRHPRLVEEWEATGRTTLDELGRMSALIDGLLMLARAGADAPASRVKVRVVECVDAVVAQLSASAERKDWDQGGTMMFAKLKPKDSALFMTSFDVGTNCDGTCESKDWAKTSEKVEFAQFRDGKIIKDELGKSSHLMIAEKGDKTYVRYASWTDGARRYTTCGATLDAPLAAAAPAFAKACEAMSIKGAD